jgi:glucose/mannose-6-phosphate isomerase
MLLDEFESFANMDPEGMLAAIDSLPEQLRTAWKLGQRFDLPEIENPKVIVMVGMGGSAIGADLLQSYAVPISRIPITVWRNYDLPGSVDGPGALVVASSHSGNTEEVLSAFKKAGEIGATRLAITTGGELAKMAKEAGTALWTFEHLGQPRAAVGFSFGLLLALVSRMGLVRDQTSELNQAVGAMEDQGARIKAEVPIVQNMAKRVAGQLMGRWPTVVGAEHLAPVARRWSTQINEIAKAVCQFQEIPEGDHNFVAGVNNPEELLGKTMVLFLQSNSMHPRNIRRMEITRDVMMVEGFNTDMVSAEGETRLSEQWTALHFGDYVAFYLAMSYGVDPSPVHAIESLKRKLAKAE